MAASPTLTSNYNGDVLDYIVEEAVVGNEAFDKGSLYVIDGVQNKISVPKMVSSANPINRREAMPTTKSATITWSEATITPVEMQIYVNDINPRIFEAAWREFQPKGSLPDKVMDPRVQKVFADVVLRQAKKQMGKLIFQGDTTLASTDPMSFFNGFATLSAASSTNIDVANIGPVNQATIIAILEAVIASIPDALFDDPDFKIHMSTAAFRAYQAADRALLTKGSPTYGAAAEEYGGKKIVYYSQFPTNVIIGCVANTGTESNFYAAVDKVNDMDNFKIERLRPEGELFFLLAKFKMAVGFRLDSESVYYIGS
jgi:hypothetical protein